MFEFNLRYDNFYKKIEVFLAKCCILDRKYLDAIKQHMSDVYEKA